MISTKSRFPDFAFILARNLLFFTIVALVFSQCVDKRDSPDSSAIGITVCYKSGKQCHPLNRIYFVKIDNANKDPYSQDDFILSNFPVIPVKSNGKDVFLLNAKSGQYAAIGGKAEEKINFPGKKEKTRIRIYFFPEEMIKLTITDLKPAQFSYMGNYVIDDTGEPLLSELFKISKADKAQMHYCRKICPDRANPTKGSCLFEALASFVNAIADAPEDDETVYAAKIIKSEKDIKKERTFFKRAHRELARTEWLPLIENAMK